jgi:histidine triad (HIT) family protein
MNDCIFCKIARHEVPGAIFYETEKFIAIVDILPNTFGHSLVIPKEHSKNIYEITEDVLSDLGKELQKVARAVKSATGAQGINAIMNNEPAAGQVIFHSHIHLIPRFTDDGLHHWPQKKYANDTDLEKMRQKLAEAISS